MGNCLMGGNKVEKIVEEEKIKRKDGKVKIILRRDELEKLLLFQLNANGAKGETTLASFGDFLKELEAERFAGEEAAAVGLAAAAAAEESFRRCRKWRPSLDRIIEWPEEVIS